MKCLHGVSIRQWCEACESSAQPPRVRAREGAEPSQSDRCPTCEKLTIERNNALAVLAVARASEKLIAERVRSQPVAVTPPTAPERCPTCDKPRAECPTVQMLNDGQRSPSEVREAAKEYAFDCRRRAVDWRARALAAEPAAAQWARVAPLIERLRAECGEPPFRGRVPSLIECAAAILAATEATP